MNQFKKLNFNQFIVLVSGYIQHSNILPSVIIEICIKYLQPLDVTPANDPANFISDNDTKLCDYYKVQGNEYFKQKCYYCAVTKYTTALRLNPNNHLILCNRSLCYYYLKQYEQALLDAFCCINTKPTFYKRFFRLGCILQQKQQYVLAGIAYKAAYHICINWNTVKKPNHPLHNHYQKYIKYIKRSLSNGKHIVKEIITFDERGLQMLFKKFQRDQQILTQRILETNNIELQFDPNFQYEIMHSPILYLNDYESMEAKLYSLIEQSKCYYYINKNKLTSITDSTWTISWSVESIKNIGCNKRCSFINVYSCDKKITLARYCHFGVPSAKDILYCVYRTMSFSTNLLITCKTKAVKPSSILMYWRSRHFGLVDEIAIELGKLGIECFEHPYELSKLLSDQSETNVYGWNYMNEN